MGLFSLGWRSGRNFGCPAARAIEPVQDVDVRVKKSVPPSKRSHHCFFGIVRSDPHGGQNSPLWLTSSCKRGREARPSNHHPSCGPAPETSPEGRQVPRIGSCTERMQAGSIDPRKAIMRFRWIIVVGAVDLVIAWWREKPYCDLRRGC
jgi:hypothetical protein